MTTVYAGIGQTTCLLTGVQHHGGSPDGPAHASRNRHRGHAQVGRARAGSRIPDRADAALHLVRVLRRASHSGGVSMTTTYNVNDIVSLDPDLITPKFRGVNFKVIKVNPKTLKLQALNGAG